MNDIEVAMFIKRCSRTKNGKEHRYWQLVESYRTARGPRHRVVAYLGDLAPTERRGWARLANHLDGKAARRAQQQLLLFETRAQANEESVPETVEVCLKGVRVEQTRDLGDVFLGLILWRMLGLDELLDQTCGGDGGQVWPSQTHLGDGPRHGQRSEPGFPSFPPRTLLGGYTSTHAQGF